MPSDKSIDESNERENELKKGKKGDGPIFRGQTPSLYAENSENTTALFSQSPKLVPIDRAAAIRG